MKPVCLIMGAGAGIGGTVGKSLQVRATTPCSAGAVMKQALRH